MRYRSGGGALGVERKDAMIARVFVNSLTQSAGSFQRSGPSHPEPRPPPLLLAGIYFPKGCGACASAISCRSDIALDLHGADYRTHSSQEVPTEKRAPAGELRKVD